MESDLFSDMAPEVSVEEIDTSVEFRPTLVIGLGGTGHHVLVRLKARFLETFGQDILKIVKLLVFDTADETLVVKTGLGLPVSLTKETELVNIGHVPVSGLVKNIGMHPTIQTWLPEDLPVRAITAGAQQVRPLGRLALFYHFNQDARIRDRLLSTIRALGNIKLRGKLGESAQIAKSRGISIFIVCSVCGGTGSGMFLDMAYLVRDLFQFSGIRQEFCYTYGVLVLPQAFANVAKDDIMANAYAALRELEYYSMEGNFFTRYPDGTMVDIHNRPFSICYLVDAVNERGKLLAGLEDLAPMVSESLFLQIGSPVGEGAKSVFDNVKSLDRVAQNPEGKESPTAFSSLGTAALIFPAGRIINTCAYRFGIPFIAEGLLGQVDRQQTDQSAKQFIEQTQLAPQPLLVEISRDTKGNPISVSLATTPLEDIPHDQLLQGVEKMLGQYRNVRLNKDFKLALDADTQKIQGQVQQKIRAETARLIDNPDYGPRYALAFLEQLSERYSRIIGGLGKDRAQIQERLNRGKKGMAAQKQALVDAIGSFVLRRGHRVAKARDAYIRAVEGAFRDEFEINKRNAAMRLLSELKTVVDEQVKEVAALIDKLQQVHDRFEQGAKEIGQVSLRMPFVLSTDITDDKDVDNYYNQYRREVKQEVVRFIEKIGSLYEWRGRPAKDIAQDIFDFVGEPFMPVGNEKVEKIIEAKRSRVPLERRLEDLRDDSVPFWNYNVTRMREGGDMESVVVIGVEDHAHSIYTDLIRKGESLISTRDPHQVAALHSKHGLPIFALEQIDFYRQKYDEHIKRQISPLHLFPNLPWLRDIEESKQWFALAEAFGLIEKKGQWYYCKPKDERLDDIRLGVGLKQSLERFLSDSQLLKDVEEVLEARIIGMGNDAAAVIIYDYERRKRATDQEVAKIEQELQLAAGAFREKKMGYDGNRVIAVKAEMEKKEGEGTADNDSK